MIFEDYLYTERNEHILNHLQWFHMTYSEQFGHTLHQLILQVRMNQVKQQRCLHAVQSAYPSWITTFQKGAYPDDLDTLYMYLAAWEGH